MKNALSAAGRRALLFAAAGLVLACVMLLLSTEFVALHCVVLAALTLAAALSCAWAVVPMAPQFARRAGVQGGVTAAVGYALPFIAYFVYRIITLNTETAAQLAGDMSAAQTTNLVQQGIFPGVEYFRGQFISYAIGYLLFALVFGMLLGALGGILAQRQSKA